MQSSHGIFRLSRTRNKLLATIFQRHQNGISDRFKKKNLDEKEKGLISAETQTFSLIRSKFVITGSSH